MNPWKKLREDAEKTQFEIAIETNYKPSTVAAWEADRGNPSLARTAVLAKAFKTTEKRVRDIIVAQKSRPVKGVAC